MAGDRKQAVAAMRAICKTLNDELGLTKAIARATYRHLLCTYFLMTKVFSFFLNIGTILK